MRHLAGMLLGLAVVVGVYALIGYALTGGVVTR